MSGVYGGEKSLREEKILELERERAEYREQITTLQLEVRQMPWSIRLAADTDITSGEGTFSNVHCRIPVL